MGVTNAFLKDMEQDFALKHFGGLHCFLRIEVKKSHNVLILPQERYVTDVIKRVHMSKCKAINTLPSSTEKMSVTQER